MATRYNIKEGYYLAYFNPTMESAVIGKITACFGPLSKTDEKSSFQMDVIFSKGISRQNRYEVSSIFGMDSEVFNKDRYHDLITSVFANLEICIKGI